MENFQFDTVNRNTTFILIGAVNMGLHGPPCAEFPEETADGFCLQCCQEIGQGTSSPELHQLHW
jgi:hypothetical protein